MGRAFERVVASWAAAVAASACTPYAPAIAEVEGGADAHADGGAPTFDAGDAGDGASSLDLVTSDGFETGACGPPLQFDPGKTTAIATSPARTGAYACRMCNVGAPQGTFGLYQELAAGIWGPGRYTLDAYFRFDGDAGKALGVAQLTVKSSTSAPPRYLAKNVTIDASSWANLQVVADVAAGEYLSDVAVSGYSETTGPCVLVDDVRVVRE